jgi:hypothetical protein
MKKVAGLAAFFIGGNCATPVGCTDRGFAYVLSGKSILPRSPYKMPASNQW